MAPRWLGASFTRIGRFQALPGRPAGRHKRVQRSLYIPAGQMGFFGAGNRARGLPAHYFHQVRQGGLSDLRSSRTPDWKASSRLRIIANLGISSAAIGHMRSAALLHDRLKARRAEAPIQHHGRPSAATICSRESAQKNPAKTGACWFLGKAGSERPIGATKHRCRWQFSECN